jgi:WhiB family redox-sensing transcriptional regulator
MSVVGLFQSICNNADWIDLAICPQTDPEIFFPDRGQRSPQAKIICGRCPVMEECLEYALANRVHGFWGGFSERERQKMKRKIA